jgi:hypothetical protein
MEDQEAVGGRPIFTDSWTHWCVTFEETRDKARAAKAYAKKAGLGKDIILNAAAMKVQAERRWPDRRGPQSIRT